MRCTTLVHAIFLLLSGLVSADVMLVSPAAGSTQAGGATTLTWTDSGSNPALASIQAADIILCTGTNAAPLTLYTIAGAVAIGSVNSLAVTIPLTIGASGQYFLKFVSTTALGYVVTTYSSRFTLTGMTGTAIANTALAVSGPPGVTPTAALTETAAATAKAATTATTAAAGGAAGLINLAGYLSQTAITRTGPPQDLPGTKITALAATAKPLFPTSAYTPYVTAAAPPLAVTTLTASPTWTVVTLENDAPPATFTAN